MDTNVRISLLLSVMLIFSYTAAAANASTLSNVSVIMPASATISAGQNKTAAANFSSLSPQNLTINNRECQLKFECQEKDGLYWFDCGFDQATGSCKCYLGEMYRCKKERSSLVLNETKEPPKAAVVSLPPVQRKEVVSAIIIALLVAFMAYRRLRDSPENNLRKAVHYHKLGEEANEKNKAKKANHYYELAEQYRQKVFGR